MKQFSFKSLLPHAVAVGIFLIIALIYCKPALEGKVLQQDDNVQWQGMSKDQKNVQEKTGTVPLWNNSMFGGMPGYLIISNANNVVPYYVAKVASFGLPKPANFFFLACICFYILSLALGVNSWIAILGALSYAYATYNPVIVAAGHDTKMLSIALLPGLLAGLQLIYTKKYWLGASLTAAFMGALVAMNHYQIVYYGAIIAAFMTVGYAIIWIKEKAFTHLLLAGAITVGSVAIGVLSNSVVLFTTAEYSKSTIRGGSSLPSDGKQESKVGLSESYAMSYSMYKAEPFVLFIPRIFGGSSNPAELPQESSKAIEALQALPQELGQQLAPYLHGYWGGIGGTSGPPYAGAIICFLAIIGFVVLNNQYKWWILACSLLAIMMSWGSFFIGFNSILLKYLPMYNKFRAPSMIMVIPTLLFGIMAVLTLQYIAYGEGDKKLLWAKFVKGLYAAAAVFAMLFVLYITFDYQGENDKEVLKQLTAAPENIQQGVRSVFNALTEDRKALFFADILRCLFFCAAATAGLWALIKTKVTPQYIIIGLAALSFIDLMSVDSKYLKSENYVDKETYESNNFLPTAADKQVLVDTTHYRVLDLTRGGLGSALTYGSMTAYFHKSIGGYHPAKLSIYQDLIDQQLSKFPNCLPVLNMLNTKYIIGGNQDGQAPAVQQNPMALGNVWFVKQIKYTQTPKEEMDALTNFDPKDTVVTNIAFKNILKADFSFDSTATIKLISNTNDIVTYTSSAATPQLAVFSEIYYKDGWNVYVDGVKADYAKANYVLRAMMVPAGNHNIVFKFEPSSHAIGWTITNIASTLLVLLLVLAAYFSWRNNSKAD